MSTNQTIVMSCDGCGIDQADDPELKITTHTLVFDGEAYEHDLCEECLSNEWAVRTGRMNASNVHGRIPITVRNAWRNR